MSRTNKQMKGFKVPRVSSSMGGQEVVVFPALLLLSCMLLAINCQDIVGTLNGIEKQQTGNEGSVISSPSSRAVYSPRGIGFPHHQIMHFGKRPSNPLASSNRIQELYLQRQASRLPSWFSQAQSLEPLEEEITAFEFPNSAANQMNNNRMPLYSIIAPNPLASPDQSLDGLSDQRNKLISRLLFQGGNNNNDNGNWNSPIKFSRLISPDSPTSSAEQVDQQAAKSDLVNNTGGQQEQQLVEQAAISVATRSPHGGNVAGIRGSVSSLGAKNYISALLLGRASTPSQISSFGPFIKKAEPKDNIFMHFGRK